MEKTLYFNGKIFTSDTGNKEANAMIVKGAEIDWVGNLAELMKDVENFKGEKVDLEQKRVLPGFLDSHMHPIYLANALKKIPCVPPAIYSLEDLAKEIRRRRRDLADGEWIEGWGYDEEKFKERKGPDRIFLDQVCADAPVLLIRSCLHIAAVNSCALKLAGIDKNTPNPPGGEIGRDPSGEPTGILKERAIDLITAAAPKPDKEQEASNMVLLGEKLLSQGVTAVAECMGAYGPVDCFDVYEAAAAKGMRQRVAIYYLWDRMKEDPEALSRKKGLECRRDRNRQVFEAGVKILGDGSISGRTAWMSKPYVNDGGNCGMFTTTVTDLNAAADYASERGLQIMVHAMGERTTDLVLDTLALRTKWTDQYPHIRIEHVTVPSARALKLAAENGIPFSTQPIFLFCEIESYEKYMGKDALAGVYPINDILDAGVELVFSSDSPATSWADPSNPFVTIGAAVSRVAYDGTPCGERHRVTAEDAVRFYTAGAANILGIPKTGSLKKGNQADFIILSEDLFAVAPEKIHEVQVDKTFMGGVCVFERGKEEPFL